MYASEVIPSPEVPWEVIGETREIGEETSWRLREAAWQTRLRL
jgi:hypothetical protein